MTARKAIFGVLGVAAAAVWAYWGTLSAPWLFDDHELLERMGAWTADTAPWTGGFGQSLLASPRPLRQLTFWVDSWLWGGGEAARAGGRAENLALHAGVAALWGALLLRLGSRPAVAWGSAAVFAVLPLHWETLGVVSHRKELLAALFGLMGLLGLGAGRRRWKTLGLGACALAVLGKETAVAFPLLAVVLDGWDAEKRRKTRAWRVGRAWGAAALGLAVALGAAAWGQTRRSMAENIPSWDGRTGIAADATGWVDGIRLAVQSFPRHVAAMAGWNAPCMERREPPRAGWRGTADLAASGVFCAAWAWLAWFGWRKGRAWGAAMGWVAIALALASFPPLLAGGGVKGVAGRYDYVAAMGLAWLATDGCARLPSVAGGGAILALVVAFGAACRSHAPEFQSERALWTATLEQNDCSKLALFNLAQAFREEGDVWGGAAFLADRVRELGRNPFAKGEAPPIAVAVAGDSVPYGWNDAAPGLSLSLAARLRSRAEAEGEGADWLFSNWAVPGSRLSELPAALERRLSANRADQCVLMAGHNDAMDGEDAETMLEDAGNAALECLLGGAEPIWVGPVPVEGGGNGDRAVQAVTLADFGRALGEQCGKAGIRHLDFGAFAAVQEGGAAAWTEGGNGVHLNFAGMENLAGFVFHEGLKGRGEVSLTANGAKTTHERTQK